MFQFHASASSGSYSSPQQTVKVSSGKSSQLQLVKRPVGTTGMTTVPRTQSLTAPKIKFSAGPQGRQLNTYPSLSALPYNLNVNFLSF